jgi:hypothetical protein
VELRPTSLLEPGEVREVT